MTYERVERLDSSVCRPVLILGPLAEPLINKITSESPDRYQRCQPGQWALQELKPLYIVNNLSVSSMN